MFSPPVQTKVNKVRSRPHWAQRPSRLCHPWLPSSRLLPADNSESGLEVRLTIQLESMTTTITTTMMVMIMTYSSARHTCTRQQAHKQLYIHTHTHNIKEELSHCQTSSGVGGCSASEGQTPCWEWTNNILTRQRYTCTHARVHDGGIKT